MTIFVAAVASVSARIVEEEKNKMKLMRGNVRCDDEVENEQAERERERNDKV